MITGRELSRPCSTASGARRSRDPQQEAGAPVRQADCTADRRAGAGARSQRTARRCRRVQGGHVTQ